jgi:hypothetical protein
MKHRYPETIIHEAYPKLILKHNAEMSGLNSRQWICNVCEGMKGKTRWYRTGEEIGI